MVTGKKKDRWGWETNTATKSYMISEFTKILSETEPEIKDEELLKQALALSRVGSKIKTTRADDLLMSAMIAVSVGTRAPSSPSEFVGHYGHTDWF